MRQVYQSPPAEVNPAFKQQTLELNTNPGKNPKTVQKKLKSRLKNTSNNSISKLNKNTKK